jgi:histidyl-tRNA synthetase
MESIRAIKGTRDILPEEVSLWQRIEAAARHILTRASYCEIRTPIFEQTSLFVRGIGTATDIVGKEMYSFQTRGEDDITLRPENTAGVVRAFIQHGLFASGDVQRLWYTGPMFRYERPQAGRQRQFHQLGLEVMGSDDPRADSEAIALAVDILKVLGLSNLSVALNSVGSGADRQTYRQALVDYLTPYQSELDEDSQDRLGRNPLRILDSKSSRTQEILADAPQLLDYLSPASREHFERVQSQLECLGIAYSLNPRLVRGLDYYSHTAFEIQSDDLGAQNAVCGGGRYDGLVAELGGPDTPAVGWAMGLERLILLMQQQSQETKASADVYVVSRGREAEDLALAIAQQLRQAQMTVVLDLSRAKFNKQFKRADRSGAIWAVILGDDEATKGKVQVKHLQTGDQREMNAGDLVRFLQTAPPPG